MRTLIFSSILVCLVFSGCSNKPVPSSEYLLRPHQANTDTSGASTSIVLGNVGVPPYLDQRGIVLETAPSEINAARNHRWAEPLTYSVQRYLQVAIGQAANLDIGGQLTPKGDVEKQINVVIHQLHASVSGNVRLVAEWRILDSRKGEVLAHKDFSASETLDVDGYPAVVRAHEELLNRLAAAIAAEL